MDHTINISGEQASAKLSGQLTFVDAKKFKDILDLTSNGTIKSISLDFSGITFIDSSGMGMLLLLRDECLGKSVSLNIMSPQGQVEKIFKISKFYDLFTIS